MRAELAAVPSVSDAQTEHITRGVDQSRLNAANGDNNRNRSSMPAYLSTLPKLHWSANREQITDTIHEQPSQSVEIRRHVHMHALTHAHEHAHLLALPCTVVLLCARRPCADACLHVCTECIFRYDPSGIMHKVDKPLYHLRSGECRRSVDPGTTTRDITWYQQRGVSIAGVQRCVYECVNECVHA